MEKSIILLQSRPSSNSEIMPEQNFIGRIHPDDVARCPSMTLLVIQDDTAQIINSEPSKPTSPSIECRPSPKFKNINSETGIDRLVHHSSKSNHKRKRGTNGPRPSEKLKAEDAEDKEMIFPKKVCNEAYRKQFFSRKWLENPEFKDWLRETISPVKGFCRYCKSELTAGKSELQRHSKSARHIRNSLEHEAVLREQSPELDCSFLSVKGESVIITNTTSVSKTQIIDYRSDSLSIPSYAMRKAMVQAQTGDTSYGTDKTVKDFEIDIAALLKKERGLFFPTNTMANLVAVLAHCRSRGSAVFVGDKSDLHVTNRKALVRFGGLHWCTLQNTLNGSFSLEELEEMLKNVDKSLQHLICFESTNVILGGVVTPVDWVDQLQLLCKSYNSLLHCDGTRLVNASVYLKTPLSDLVEHCHSVTFGLDKGLGAPFGAVLAGEENFIRRCEFLRNSLGGHIHQAGLFAAAGYFALELMPAVESDHLKALTLARAVLMEKGKRITVDLDDVHTNIVHLHCPQEQVTAEDLCRRLSEVYEDMTDDVPILCETVDDETVALRVHRGISERDLSVTTCKLRRIIQDIKLVNPKKTKKVRKSPRKRS